MSIACNTCIHFIHCCLTPPSLQGSLREHDKVGRLRGLRHAAHHVEAQSRPPSEGFLKTNCCDECPN